MNDQLDELKEINCPFQVIGCSDDVRLDSTVTDHLNSQNFSHSQLVIDAINHLTNDLQDFRRLVEIQDSKIEFQNDQINILKDEVSIGKFEIISLKDKVDRHKLEIQNLRTESENTKILVTEVKNDIITLKEDVDILQQYDAKRLCDIGEVKEDYSKFSSKLSILSEEFNIAKVEIERSKHPENICEELAEHTTEIENIKTDIKLYHEEVEKIRLRIKTMVLDSRYDFVWTIDNFSKRRNWFQSEGFYKDNYRLCLNGWIGGLFGVYLKLYFCIMKGDRDGQAMWPMRHSVTITIMNQDTDQGHISWRSQYDITSNDSTAFSRPTKLINSNVGGPWMYLKDIHNTNGLLIYDSIKVCCILHPPAIG